MASTTNTRTTRKANASSTTAGQEMLARRRKATPAKPAAAKAAPAKPAKPVAAKTYAATARSGKTNQRNSTTVLTHALDVKIANRKNAALWSAGVIVAMYGSLDAAQKVADEINAGAVGDWSDAVVTPVKLVTVAVSA
ncbi:MAG: hypothetical protein ACLPYO_03845 [Mycobacterium sp.]